MRREWCDAQPERLPDAAKPRFQAVNNADNFILILNGTISIMQTKALVCMVRKARLALSNFSMVLQGSIFVSYGNPCH